MLDQNCIVLNWNARGLNNKTRRDVVRKMVSETRATVVTIQETKLELVDRAVVFETLGSRFVDNFVVLPASGTRGGILLAVDEDFYSLAVTERGVHSVTALISANSGLVQWHLAHKMITPSFSS
jgi:exonuclease III